MLTPRIFVGDAKPTPCAGEEFPLPPAAARHVAQVLRMRRNDTLALFAGTAGEYTATIIRIDRHGVVVQVERFVEVEREAARPLTLVQATIAADMMDLVVRKAVELGASAIVPVQAARSQALAPDRATRRMIHWRRIAIAACEQCGRNRVPSVAPVVAWSDWLAGAGDAQAPIAILDHEAARSLASVAAASAPRTLVIGPEGGFTHDEMGAALRCGAIPAHLGPRVLRAETAALAALAIVGAPG
ncbi:MAG TPA: 16S rRNA (uracil(1498)-N(3))-methyltransferase [Casimicrobiaceae bacterium]|nr:16S rRNA (uracil(1498)-N(3))-methyltransferase [Casimicrobiaceae bacterium]